MRYFLCLAASAVALLAPTYASQGELEGSHSKRLIISAEVAEVVPAPFEGDKGGPLQLVTYKVKSVCEGAYTGKVVSVYHVPDSEGIKGIQVGEKQCIRITESLNPRAPGGDPAALAELKSPYFALDVIRRCQCTSP